MDLIMDLIVRPFRNMALIECDEPNMRRVDPEVLSRRRPALPTGWDDRPYPGIAARGHRGRMFPDTIVVLLMTTRGDDDMRSASAYLDEAPRGRIGAS
jgi:hypothetical protein